MGAEVEYRWDVFLAHPSEELPVARLLADALVAEGISVCLDDWALRPGDAWQILLPRFQRESRITVAIVAGSTPDAYYEQAEIVRAVEQVRRVGHRLIPVHLADGLDPPYGTEPIHHIDLFDVALVDDVAHQIADLVRHPDRLPPLHVAQILSPLVPAVPRWFTGRDQLVEKLARDHIDELGNVSTVTLSGMGGVGKTTVAAAIVDARRHELDVVWWLRADSEATLIDDLIELGKCMKLELDEAKDRAARQVVQKLETKNRRWLLVFDNATDIASVNAWRPVRGKGTVLITTRQSTFAALGPVVDVAVFDQTVAAQFLRDRVRDENPAAAAEPAVTEVAQRLDGLPLALEQAAAFVARVPYRRFAGYLELYDRSDASAFSELPPGYERT